MIVRLVNTTLLLLAAVIITGSVGSKYFAWKDYNYDEEVKRKAMFVIGTVFATLLFLTILYGEPV